MICYIRNWNAVLETAIFIGVEEIEAKIRRSVN